MLKRKIYRVIAGVMTAIFLIQGSGIYASAEEFALPDDYYDDENAEVEEITTVKDMSLVCGDTEYTYAIIWPGSAADNEIITWASSDESVAITTDSKISSCYAYTYIKAVSPGTAKITVSASNGVSASFKCTVKSIPITGIEISESSHTVTKGKSFKLRASIKPYNTTNDKTIKWTSSNKKVATVTSSGKEVTVKAVGGGKATITATTSNGKKITCKVTVKSPITGVKISNSSKTVKKGKSFKLTATIVPSDTTDSKTIKWTSSNKKVVKVSGSGKTATVKAVGKGKATITATTSNGKKITCKVTVK
jgi:uncharacterized protein YjdB